MSRLIVGVTLSGALFGGILASGVLQARADSSPSASTSPIAAIQQTVLEGNNLYDNQAVPAPQGVTDPNWALAGDSPAGGFSELSALTTSTALTNPQYQWVVDGTFDPLTSTQASALISLRQSQLATLFTGQLLARMQSAVQGLVTLSNSDPNYADAPGGFSIVSWGPIVVTGTQATVECTVDTWRDVDHYQTGANGIPEEVAQLATGSKEEYLNLTQNSAGSWLISYLNSYGFSFSG